MTKHLFTVPVSPCGPHPGGSITVTEPSPAIYLVTFISPPDNRLTTALCRALLAALDLVEHSPHLPPGVLVTTSGIPKFYSNGLDLDHAVSTDGFWPLFYSLWLRLLRYPMPTVAWLNGHAFAGGLMLAMAHDYRLANPARGFICLNELLFGAPLKPAMAALFRAKLPSPAALRALALEARRLTGPDAVEAGLADHLAKGWDDVLEFVFRRLLLEKPRSGVYGVIKQELYKDLIRELEGAGLEGEEKRFDEDRKREAERKEFGKVFVEQWTEENKAKL